MTVPFFIEEPLTWKKIEVPCDIVQYCDTFTTDADRDWETLQVQVDCASH